MDTCNTRITCTVNTSTCNNPDWILSQSGNITGKNDFCQYKVVYFCLLCGLWPGFYLILSDVLFFTSCLMFDV